MMEHQITDRTAAKTEIQRRADQRARERGYVDHIDELDHDYRQWQDRAGIPHGA